MMAAYEEGVNYMLDKWNRNRTDDYWKDVKALHMANWNLWHETLEAFQDFSDTEDEETNALP